ncbi:MAG: tRNA/rRNA methyltransferase [Bacteroidales bacterium]|nr:tRNA/rRNA methyltransferase [Bacteroidales bacterium]
MNISFILVEPAVPENVGAAARALKTMGFNDLRLVNPCDYLSMDARKLAHASTEILENAKVYNTLQAALNGIDFAIATSAKHRWVKQDVIPVNELHAFIEDKKNTINSLAVVFGREESGLTNDEMALCHRTATVPMKTKYPSLNLAQSVMIFAFMLSSIEQETHAEKEMPEAETLKALINKANLILNDIDLGPNKLIHGRIIESLTGLDANAIKLLHSITTAIISKYSIK